MRILSEQAIFYIGGILCFIYSLYGQIRMLYFLRAMEKDAENIQEGNSKLFRECILEYDRGEIKGNGIRGYLEQYIKEIKIGNVSLVKWKHMSGQSLLLGIFIAGSGACVKIIQGETLGMILPFYLISFVALYAYISLSGWIDMEHRIRRSVTILEQFLMEEKYYGIYTPIKKSTVDIENQMSSYGKEESIQLRELLKEILT